MCNYLILLVEYKLKEKKMRLKTEKKENDNQTTIHEYEQNLFKKSTSSHTKYIRCPQQKRIKKI
jgi:hypothetical protein